MYLSLNHMTALSSEFQNALIHVDACISLQNLQHDVQHDECAGPANSSATVHHQIGRIGGDMTLAYMSNEPQQSCGIARYPVIWP